MKSNKYPQLVNNNCNRAKYLYGLLSLEDKEDFKKKFNFNYINNKEKFIDEAFDMANKEDLTTILYHDRFAFELPDKKLQFMASITIKDKTIPAINKYTYGLTDHQFCEALLLGFDQIVGYGAGSNYLESFANALIEVERIEFLEKKLNEKTSEYGRVVK